MSMDVFEALHSRRSVRQYTDEKIPQEELHILLDAAMSAPSAGNAQPWHFIILEEPDILSRIPAINQYAAMAPKAPLSILTCADLNAEKYPGFWVQDCSAAMQNLMLAATALGIGTVWTGVYPEKDRISGFRALLGLPENIIPLGLVVVGRPEHAPKRQSRFDASKIHRNGW